MHNADTPALFANQKGAQNIQIHLKTLIEFQLFY